MMAETLNLVDLNVVSIGDMSSRRSMANASPLMDVEGYSLYDADGNAIYVFR